MRRLFVSIAAFISVVFLCADTFAKSEGLRVMTFNIRVQFPSDTGDLSWEARKAGCVKAIKKHKPDLIGLQEAFYGPKAFFLKEMPEYQVVDRSGKPGTLDPDLRNNENPIYYRADRFELLDYGSFWLNEDQTPDKKGWDAMNVRNLTWVKLRLRKSGQIIFYFNTHFDHIGTSARYNSSALIVEKIKEIAGDEAVVFLNADFNMPSGDRDIKPLESYLQQAELTVKKPDKGATFNDFGRPGSKPMWLDHIFYRNAQAKSFEVIDEPKYGVKYISDHFPVFADFTIAIPKR